MVAGRPTIIGAGTPDPESSGGYKAPPSTEEEEAEFTPYSTGREPLSEFDWRAKFRTDIVSQAEKWAESLGVSKFALDALVRDNIDRALNYITQSVVLPKNTSTTVNLGDGVLEQRSTGLWQPESPQDWQQVWNAGVMFYSALAGVDLAGISSGRGRGSGSGSRGPTAEDIRNMFDEDELTSSVEALWGAHLLEDTKKARSIAKNYINAIVKSGGKKEIDFKTYVTSQMEKEARWQLIYQNKPEGVEPLQYAQKYYQMAQAAVGGGQGNKQLVGNLAAGGAALGASADAFAGRLARTDAQRNSKGFINGLEETVRGVKNVLRG